MIRVEVKSSDLKSVSSALIGDENPFIGKTIQLTDDSSLTYLNGLGEHLTVNDLITFALEATKDISIGLIGAIIYDRLKEVKTISLFINGKTVKVAKDEIIEALEEHFRKLPKDGE